MKAAFAVLLLAGLIAAYRPTAWAQQSVREISIKSLWGGLGTPQKTTLVIRADRGIYNENHRRIDTRLVDDLVAALKEDIVKEPALRNLGVTKDWLERALQRSSDGSPLREVTEGDENQKALFRSSYTDDAVLAQAVPGLFTFDRTDDYPFTEVIVTFDDGSSITASSHSQYQFMLPWKIETEANTMSTFNADISRAIGALMPPKAANRWRILGTSLDRDLSEEVMSIIEPQWKLLGVQDRAGDALERIRSTYKINTADINSYHDVAYGLEWKKNGPREDNLQLSLTKPSFPNGFLEHSILLVDQGKVSGVENFLAQAGRYEDLALSVPWLADLLQRFPGFYVSLLWVHDRSFSEKAMREFAADMHSLGKDEIADKVRKVQRDVALIGVTYGDYWLVLPDRSMVLWRFTSVSGLLNRDRSNFTVAPCTDYQAVTGGCVGAVVSPEGVLQK